jgi:hypothetical protein
LVGFGVDGFVGLGVDGFVGLVGLAPGLLGYTPASKSPVPGCGFVTPGDPASSPIVCASADELVALGWSHPRNADAAAIATAAT